MWFFADSCPTGLIGQPPTAQLPRFHFVTPQQDEALAGCVTDSERSREEAIE